MPHSTSGTGPSARNGSAPGGLVTGRVIGNDVRRDGGRRQAGVSGRCGHGRRTGGVTTTVVRAAEPRDAEALARLLAELHEEPAGDPSKRFAATLDVVLGTPGHHLCVAEHDGRVVGTAVGVVVPNLSRDCRPFMIVENVVVTASARRLGIGRAIMEHLVGIAGEHDCYKVQLQSNGSRDAAHRFYVDLGFAPCAVGFRRYLADVPVVGGRDRS